MFLCQKNIPYAIQGYLAAVNLVGVDEKEREVERRDGLKKELRGREGEKV